MADIPQDAAPETGRFAAFGHNAFLRYWLARFFATLSVQIVTVAVGWQVYELTRDPFDLGLIGLIEFLPALLLVLVTGAVADRFGRKLVMGASILVEAFCALALLLLALLLNRGRLFGWPLFGLFCLRYLCAHVRGGRLLPR